MENVVVDQSVMLSLMVGQLKSLGYYALAKQVSEQVGVNGEPSNAISGKKTFTLLTHK
jgi:hypothetical protein